MKQSNDLVQSTEIFRCYEDDRVVIVHKQNDRITGINYAQDANMDLYEFIESWGKPDKKLTDFYYHVKSLARGRNLSEIELINEVIWVHFSYTNEINEE